MSTLNTVGPSDESSKQGGGGSDIGGSIAANQVAVGAATSNTIAGSAALTFSASAGLATTVSISINQGVSTIVNPAFSLTGGAITGQTAGGTSGDVYFNLKRTVTFATGSIGNQAAVTIKAPTYAFVGASTITAATTFFIDQAVQAGTNATLTNSYIGVLGQPTHNQANTEIMITAQSSGRTPLALVGGATGNILNLINSSGTGVSSFNSSGQLGVGKTSPTGILDVLGQNGTSNTVPGALILLTSGNGFSATSGSASSAAGTISLVSGNGGNGNATGGAGTNGGSILLSSGNGGNGDATHAGKNGGNLNFVAGTAGTDGGAGAGIDGQGFFSGSNFLFKNLSDTTVFQIDTTNLVSHIASGAAFQVDSGGATTMTAGQWQFGLSTSGTFANYCNVQLNDVEIYGLALTGYYSANTTTYGLLNSKVRFSAIFTGAATQPCTLIESFSSGGTNGFIHDITTAANVNYGHSWQFSGNDLITLKTLGSGTGNTFSQTQLLLDGQQEGLFFVMQAPASANGLLAATTRFVTFNGYTRQVGFGSGSSSPFTTQTSSMFSINLGTNLANSASVAYGASVFQNFKTFTSGVHPNFAALNLSSSTANITANGATVNYVSQLALENTPKNPNTVVNGANLALYNQGAMYTSGSQYSLPKTLSSDHTINLFASAYDDFCVINCTAQITVTLPVTAVSGSLIVPAGLFYIIKDGTGAASTAPITIAAASGETIDGLSSVTINQNYSSKTIICLSSGVWGVV